MEVLENFVVLEGIDGSGTTTQLNLLGELFTQRGGARTLPQLVKTFEPTDGPAGKLIRSVLRKETDLHPKTIAYLFAADRNEHLYGPCGIVEQCKSGKLVISDRYTPSSLVYQGISCGDDFPSRLNSGFPVPQLLVFLDIDAASAEKRLSGRPQREIYEHLEFLTEARRRYHALLPKLADAGVKVELISADKSPGEIAETIWENICKLPAMAGMK